MSETLDKIEREIAREVLDAVNDAIQDESTVRMQTWTVGVLRTFESFAFSAVERAACRYGVSREPRGGYE